MKKSLFIIVLAVVVTAAGSATYYHATVASSEELLKRQGGELEWLRHEFRLTPEQFASIQQAHEEYAPACEEMCRRINEAKAEVARIVQSSKAMTPELAAALDEAAATEVAARRAMLSHIYAVAEQMPEEQAARYLASMQRKVLEPAGTDHLVIQRGKQGTF